MQPRQVRTYRKRDLDWMIPYVCEEDRRCRWWDGKRVIMWLHGRATGDYFLQTPSHLIRRGYRQVFPREMQYPQGI